MPSKGRAASSLTYEALEREVALAAGWLRGLGAGPGHRVAFLAGASLDFAVLVQAIPRSGAAMVPLNDRLTEAELAFQLRDAEVRLLVADAPHLEPGKRCRRRSWTYHCGHQRGPAMGRGRSVWPLSDALDPDAVHSVIYTSGTTGSPKGALLTFGNFYASAVASAENLGVEPGGPLARLYAAVPRRWTVDPPAFSDLRDDRRGP